MTDDQLPAAVLWDMDGTLIDSEPYWIRSEIDLCAEFGVTWTEADGLKLVGNQIAYSASMLRDAGVELPVDDIVERLTTEVTARVRARVPWQPDGRALLERCLERGVPVALVTGSYTELAAALTATEPAFEVVVTGDRVTEGKPHPESYLTAAARLGVDIERCLALEDSPAGVASAYSSGARTVAVERQVTIENRPGLSRVRSLDSLTWEAISAIMAGEILDEISA